MFDNWHDITRRPTHQHRGVVPTAQVEWELYELIKIFDSIRPMRILEIGSQHGGTLWHWLEGAEPGAIVVNIDILQNLPPDVAEETLMNWKMWGRHRVVQHSIIGRSDDPEIHDLALKYLGGVIDFLFIDACHTYEGVKRDFEMYGPHVKKGGVIALHDLITPETSPHIRVCDLWDEIRRAGYVVQELHAGGEFGGIGVIYV